MLYDQIFIIHLERDEYRKQSIEAQFKKEGITNYQWIRAVDGQNGDLNKFDFKVIPDWVDPYSSKIMTKGEIGCSLSHYLIWRKMVDEQYDNVLILEDDIVLCENFSHRVNQIGLKLSDVDYDFVYLGCRPLRKTLEEKVNDYIVKSRYSYGTHAYILTLSGAYKLIESNYINNLLPVDEFFSILYDSEYPYTKYMSYFTDKPRLKTFSASPLLVDILDGELYNSNTYCSDPYVNSSQPLVNDYMILSIGNSTINHTDSMLRFTNSCEIYGHPYKIINVDLPDSENNKYNGNDSQKRKILKDELSAWSSEELNSIILVISNGETAIINANRDELLKKYHQITSQNANMVLFSGKKDHWPLQQILLQRNPPSPTDYKYLNSGVFIGKACNILTLLMSENSENIKDAKYYTDKYLNQPINEIHISLDFECEIFQPIVHNSIEKDIDIQFSKSRIRNKSTGTSPCILHACGHLSSFTKMHFNSICNYLGGGWNNTYKYCNTNDVETYPKIYIHTDGIQNIENALDYPNEQCIIRSKVLHRDLVDDVLKTDAEYLLFIDKSCYISNKNLLRELVQLKKRVICPMFKKGENAYWSNFWGELDDNNYYKRSFDYLNIVTYERKAIWNVPFISSIYLIHRSILEQHPLLYIENETISSVDMRICHNLRSANVFMYVTNINKYGVILENTESVNENASTIMSIEHKNTIYDMDNIIEWEEKYIHPSYLQKIRLSENISDICQEPCTDIFLFPLFTPLFCSELLQYANEYNKWSGGKENSDKLDVRLGGYENVPTQDIHLKQIGLESQWEKIISKYVAPMASKKYSGYKTKNINISFVIKYSMDGQRELTPHHDSSTYTINVCLNTEFEGGGCRFVRQNYNLNNRNIGYASMHPGKLTHYHEGLQIASGTRYVLVCFIN